MNSRKRVASIAALFLSASFGAQAAETVYTFDSVTEFAHRQSYFDITGVLTNTTAPTTVSVPNGGPFERCRDLFNLVLAHPGIYRLSVVTEPYTDGSGITFTNFIRCSVSQIP